MNREQIIGDSQIPGQRAVIRSASLMALLSLSCIPLDFLQGRDPDSFDAAPSLRSIDLSGLSPEEPATYMEIRFQFGGGTFEVQRSEGQKCAQADDADACVEQFDQLAAEQGFAEGCPPAFCYYYLAVNRGNENFVVRDLPEMLDFFGPVDTPEEALLVAADSDYSWTGDDRVIRETDEGFELDVSKLTGFCAPVEVTRFLLTISPDGRIEVLNSAVTESDPFACI